MKKATSTYIHPIYKNEGQSLILGLQNVIDNLRKHNVCTWEYITAHPEIIVEYQNANNETKRLSFMDAFFDKYLRLVFNTASTRSIVHAYTQKYGGNYKINYDTLLQEFNTHKVIHKITRNIHKGMFWMDAHLLPKNLDEWTPILFVSIKRFLLDCLKKPSREICWSLQVANSTSAEGTSKTDEEVITAASTVKSASVNNLDNYLYVESLTKFQNYLSTLHLSELELDILIMLSSSDSHQVKDLAKEWHCTADSISKKAYTLKKRLAKDQHLYALLKECIANFCTA